MYKRSSRLANVINVLVLSLTSPPISPMATASKQFYEIKKRKYHTDIPLLSDSNFNRSQNSAYRTQCPAVCHLLSAIFYAAIFMSSAFGSPIIAPTGQELFATLKEATSSAVVGCWMTLEWPLSMANNLPASETHTPHPIHVSLTLHIFWSVMIL